MADFSAMAGIGGALDVGTVVGHVVADTRGLSRGFSSAISQTQKFAAKMETSLRRIGASFNYLGRRAMIAGGAIVASFGGLVKQFGEFDSAMRRATSVSDVTEAQFLEMSRMAEKASHDLNMSALETAQGFYRLGEAGLSVTDQMKAYDTVLKFARISQMSVAESTEIIVDVINGLGLSFDETRRVADLLTKTFINATIDLGELGEGMKLVASIAYEMGSPIEDVVAAFALMAKAGVKGSQMGTALRRAFTNLLNPSRELQKLMRSWNIQVFDSENKMKSLAQIIMELSDVLADATEKEKGLITASLFGDRAISGMLSVIRNGGNDFDMFRRKLTDAAGAMDQVVDKQMYSFWEQLGALFKNLRILGHHITATMEPTIRKFTRTLDPIITRMVEWVDANKELTSQMAFAVAKVGLMLVAGGALLVTLGTIAWSLGHIIALFRIFGPMVAKIALLFTGWSGALIAVGVGVYVLRAQLSQNIEIMKQRVEWFGKVVRTVLDFIKQWWGTVVNFMAFLWDNLIEGLVDSFKDFGKNVVGVWGGIKGIFKGEGESIAESFALGFANAIETSPIKKATEGLISTVKKGVELSALYLEAFVEASGEHMKDTWGAVREQLKQDIDAINKLIMEHAPGLSKYVDLLRDLSAFEAPELPSPFGTSSDTGASGPSLRETFPGASEISWWSSGIQQYIDQVKEEFPTFVAYITDLMTQAAHSMEDAFTQGFKGLMSNIHNYKEVILNFVNDLTNAFNEMFARFLARWVMMKTLGGFGFDIGQMGGGLGGGLGFALGGIIPKGIKTFAQGGITQGPTLGLVGEGQFNEAVVPLPNGRSIPVDFQNTSSLNSGFGGGQAPIFLQVSAIDGPSTMSFFKRNIRTLGSMLSQLKMGNHPSRRFE